MISAVFFDFGGVLLSSPFEAFARYEDSLGLPPGSIRLVNATDHHHNAWARLERGEIGVDEFIRDFEAEADGLGFRVDGSDVIDCLRGELRPQMVEALRRCHEEFRTALLTNNFVSGNDEWSAGGQFGMLPELFDEVVESSAVGTRKPEPRFYEIALERMDVQADEVVFLDDLGINLKPARELGMRTIKVEDPDEAIDELEAVLGRALR